MMLFFFCFMYVWGWEMTPHQVVQSWIDHESRGFTRMEAKAILSISLITSTIWAYILHRVCTCCLRSKEKNYSILALDIYEKYDLVAACAIGLLRDHIFFDEYVFGRHSSLQKVFSWMLSIQNSINYSNEPLFNYLGLPLECFFFLPNSVWGFLM